MKILALDTSGKQAGVAIMDEYITIGEILINAQSGPKAWHHSEILMPAVNQLFELSGLSLCDIDYIAYTSGPGSFTGLRIGAATALGLSRGIEKPTIPVPTLDALAYNMLYHADAARGNFKENTYIVPLMDARRGQVYAAIYVSGQGEDCAENSQLSSGMGCAEVCCKKSNSKTTGNMSGLTRQSDYMALHIDEVIKLVGVKPVIYLGDGADENKAAILANQPHALFAPANANRQRPACVAMAALYQLKAGKPSQTVDLIYVRDPQAVRNQKKP